MSRAIEVLEVFVEAARFGNVPERDEPATDAGGLEALRSAYRGRQRAKGLCVYCPRFAARGKRGQLLTVCPTHRAYYARRALDRYRAAKSPA